MKKEAAVSFRVSAKLKAELGKVSAKEGRSLSQICEALLTGGLEAYKKDGPEYLQRIISRLGGKDVF